MAEDVIDDIAGEIIINLVPQALEKFGKFWRVKREIEILGNTVSTLRATLDNAETQYSQSPQIQQSFKKLKDAFYDVQDVLEQLNIEAMQRELRGHIGMIQEVRTFFSSSNQLAFRLKMSYKVREVRERMEAIHFDGGSIIDDHPVDSQIDTEWRESEEEPMSPREREEEPMPPRERYGIIGRDIEKKTIKNFLLASNEEENVSILPIVGMGGVGKTFLAQCVYNDDEVCKHFHLKMWVCVSDDFDMNNIMKNMIACAKNKKPAEVVPEGLQSKLREEIKGKMYLLFLDDLWYIEQETWQSLKDLLAGGARGSKILITTRDEKVAKIAGTASPLFLHGFSDKESLSLFRQMVCPEEENTLHSDMLAIGKEILQKCSGNALAITVIGSALLSKKTKAEWLDFKDRLPVKEAEEERVLSVRKIEERVLSVLKISYDSLHSNLKQCFAFLSLFPKGYKMKKQTLIDLWVAEGFVQPGGSSHVEVIANNYFKELQLRYLITRKKVPFADRKIVQMHNMLHDLACLVAGSICQGPLDDKKSICERTRHISHGLTSNLMGKLPKASTLRTILSVPTPCEMEKREPVSEASLRQLIQTFKRLRVLDLHSAIVKKVPRSICKLKHLTYLNFSHNNALKRLPNSITILQNLQTLNLQGCSALEELPRDMRKLVSLRNLDIDNCYNLSFVPRGLRQLTSLHRLTRFILPNGKALAKNYCGLGELNGLNDLSGSLSIENLEHSGDALEEFRAANLIQKHSLKSLILKWRYLDIDDGNTDEALLDTLKPHSNLQKLIIDRYEGESFPNWMTVGREDSLTNLVEVRLLRCGRCKRLPQLGRLPHLNFLKIWRLTELEYIELDNSSTSSFPDLSRLEIHYCKKLQAMPPTPHLSDLIVREVDLQLINQISGINNLENLEISQMESLKCLPENCLQSPTSLENLAISECPQLTSLSLGKQSLSSLKDLSLSNCEELDLAKEESDIKNLQFMHFLGVPKLVSLPRWLLKNSDLKHLSIKKCLNLKALPENIEALQSLQQLEIIRCPLLISLPEGMQKLKYLRYLRIAGCPNLEERCQKDAGEDWNKIKHIQDLSHKLKYDERHL